MPIGGTSICCFRGHHGKATRLPPTSSYDQLVEFKDDFVGVFDAGAWIASDVRPVKNLQLTGGVRADALARPGELALQPRARASYSFPQAGTKLTATAGLYTRAPEDNDENLQSNLGFERALQGTIGIKQRLMAELSLEHTTYFSRRRDLITLALDRMDEGSNDVDRGYENGGRGRSYGAEMLVRLRRGDTFGWLAYTLSRSERRDPGQTSDRLFDYDQTHNLVLVASQKLGAWRLGGRFQLTTGRPFTPVTDASFQSDLNFYRPSFGEPNSSRFDTQHQLDLRVDRSWKFRPGASPRFSTSATST